MHIKCPTDKAVVLVGIKDANGIFRFPSQSSHTPGLFFDVNPDTPINLQIIEVIQNFLGETDLGLHLAIYQNFRGDLKLNAEKDVSLYLAVLSKINDIDPSTWPTMADHLRAMPIHKNRVTYMLALQVFAGGLEQQDTLIFEGDEASRLISDLSEE